MTEHKKDEAARYNSEKVQFTLTLPLLTELESRVSAFGAAKYSKWNWAKGGKLSTPMDCMMRHTAAIQRGEWLDPDSGLPHAAHVRWNAGQIIQWYYNNRLEWDLPKFDYIQELQDDIKVAELKLTEAKKKYEAARIAAGIEAKKD